MPANVESMFYVREAPWHGLGINVEEALSSRKALEFGGLDWIVIQKEIYTEDNMLIPSFKANIRESDNKVLGVVTDRYNLNSRKIIPRMAKPPLGVCIYSFAFSSSHQFVVDARLA